MKINRLKLPTGDDKRTIDCTPTELLGRIDEVIRWHNEKVNSLNAETVEKINDMLQQWKHS